MMFFENKKILLAGGTGFVGSALVAELCAQGATVFCLTRNDLPAQPGVQYVRADLRSIQADEIAHIREAIGVVDYSVYAAASIPLAAAGKESMVVAKQNNLDAQLNFLEAFGDCAPVHVYISSVDVYGGIVSESFDEQTPAHPQSTYAVAKYCGEKYVQYFCETRGIAYNILRFAQVYGPYEPLVRMIPIMLDALLQQKPFTLKGEGAEKRRFLFVSDAVRAILAALQSPRNGVYNIAGKEVVTIAHAIEVAQQVSGKAMQITKIPSATQPLHIVPSHEKAEREIGYQPLVSFADGLRACIDAYEKK